MKVLQINTTLNSGSTGKIAEYIGIELLANNHKSNIAFGRGSNSSLSKSIKVGNLFDVFAHGLKTLIFDRHGFGSKNPTLKLMLEIDKLKPDIIHLHNIHGYYLNIEVLFKYLNKKNIPVVWTLHDCWAFTGHCTHYENINCYKWQTECSDCPKKSKYPKSILLDNSNNNFSDKKLLFNQLKSLTIITPSYWLKKDVEKSFLKNYTTRVIYNGVDLNIFRPENPLAENLMTQVADKKVILGVASVWQESKGLYDFIKLSQMLPLNYQIVLIGIPDKYKNKLPKQIICISKTANTNELAAWYGRADLFVNPTYLDNFPTTNIESLACGTPVITYNTGGSPEAIDERTGIVINKGDIAGLKQAIEIICLNGKFFYQKACRNRAETYFDQLKQYKKYLVVYEDLLKSKNN